MIKRPVSPNLQHGHCDLQIKTISSYSFSFIIHNTCYPCMSTEEPYWTCRFISNLQATMICETWCRNLLQSACKRCSQITFVKSDTGICSKCLAKSLSFPRVFYPCWQHDSRDCKVDQSHHHLGLGFSDCSLFCRYLVMSHWNKWKSGPDGGTKWK